MNTLHALLTLLKKEKFLFAGAIFALAAGVIFEAAARYLIRDIVDNAISQNINLSSLDISVAVFVAFAAAQGLSYFLAGRWKSHTTENITRDVRQRLYDHIQRLSFHYHDNTQVGELIQRSTSDVEAVNRFFGDLIPGFLQIVFKFVIYFTSIALISVKLALASSAVVPLIAFVSIFFFNRIYKAYDVHQACEADVSSAVQENLHGIRVVRAFSQQKRECEIFDEKNNKQRKAGLSTVFWHASYWPVAHILCGTQFSVAMFFAGYMALRGELSVGTMVASTFLFNGLIWPLQEMGRMITEISHSFVSFNRIDEVLRENTESALDSGESDRQPLTGEVEFRNLCFSYRDNAAVLSDVSFHCKPGETIALLGETGSGKSTIVNLLPRFYDFDSGELLLDGRPVQSYNRSFLRRNIGIVEQKPFLFTMSIRENIEYGCDREVSLDEVIEAAKAAAVHDNIMGFPEQYDTIVGEKGISLSGGQKQRIAIARTILKNPHILILDDSTSAVDSETEQSIHSALERLLEGRTTFIIAHRIETLRKADKILVLKKGSIVQSGNHEQLIEQPGFYRTIYEIQTQIGRQLEAELETESKEA